jgi:hypothetical protein
MYGLHFFFSVELCYERKPSKPSQAKAMLFLSLRMTPQAAIASLVALPLAF